MDRITYEPPTWALIVMAVVAISIMGLGFSLWAWRKASPDQIALILGILVVIGLGVFHFLF